MTQPRVPAGVPSRGGQFASPGRAESGLSLNDDAPSGAPYEGWTPEQIDTKLGEVWGRLARVEHRIESSRKTSERVRESLRGRGLSEDDIESRAAVYEVSQDVLEEREMLRDALDGINDEFQSRGGWPRGWYVTGGHVHRDRSCSTLRPSTQISLLPQLSGMTEDEIVNQAGETACTCCYPDAPVDVLSRAPKVSLPDREEAEKVRAERAEKARLKAAKAAVNTLTWATQEPVMDFGRPISSVRDAQAALKSAIYYGNYHGLKDMPINIAAAGRDVVEAVIRTRRPNLDAGEIQAAVDTAWEHARTARALHDELIAKRVELGDDPEIAQATVHKSLSASYRREFGIPYIPEVTDAQEIRQRQEWASGVLGRPAALGQDDRTPNR